MNEPLCYLHDGTYQNRSLLAIGIHEQLRIDKPTPNCFKLLDQFLHKSGHKMGCLSYDLKNSIETLTSPTNDGIGFPALFFFRPKVLLSIEKGEVKVLENNDKRDVEGLLKHIAIANNIQEIQPITLQQRTNKEQYLKDLEIVHQHLQRGDIYEVNYCQEFYADEVELDPYLTYARLHQKTKAPHSAFLDLPGFAVMCGSPERYLSQNGKTLKSQPIKGTIKRGQTAEEDQSLIEKLRNDPKERSENIMITDLVRNDLSKSAEKNSVKVKELCGIYTFETVHQMITTIESQKRDEVTFGEVMKDTFPMGSMTGAPKVRAMQIIDELEPVRRGLYSGAIGYVKPNGDFDFNVVIRSLIYSKNNKYLSAHVGGAITIASDPEREYEECLLKADALFESLK
ncbi:MAG: anthranilate synthase component I family protein [Flavobacteriales bacterium]|nr:anthranilate synthase component I family protein [Flavobacteriales bacterium]